MMDDGYFSVFQILHIQYIWMKKSEHKTEIKNCFSAYRYKMMQWKETQQVARDAFIKDADKHPRYHYLHIASCCS